MKGYIDMLRMENGRICSTIGSSAKAQCHILTKIIEKSFSISKLFGPNIRTARVSLKGHGEEIRIA